MKIRRFVVVAFMLFTSSAQATLVGAINALNPGAQYRVLFVTSTTTLGSSSDISHYNSVAQSAAVAGSVTTGLGLTWSALASTPTVSALTNTGLSNTDTSSLSIFNTNGDLLATSSADLFDGNLLAPARYDENATPTDVIVWTGSLLDGTPAVFPPIGGYELGAPQQALESAARSVAAISSYTAGFWLQKGFQEQNQHFHIYAMSSEAVRSVVPIPAALPLFGSFLGLMGFMAARRRRKISS